LNQLAEFISVSCTEFLPGLEWLGTAYYTTVYTERLEQAVSGAHTKLQVYVPEIGWQLSIAHPGTGGLQNHGDSDVRSPVV
jgi:hypothetical protein